MYGFDTASSLGEETHDPRKTAPKAIVRAVVASFVIGGLILLFAMMSVHEHQRPGDRPAVPGGLQYVVLDVLGNTVGKIFLFCVVIAMTVCCLAVHTATIRMMFAMARDNNLPAGEHLARIHPVTKTPIIPAVLIGFAGDPRSSWSTSDQPQIFTVITSIGIIMIYIAYLLVTVPMLRARAERLVADEQPGLLLARAVGHRRQRAGGAVGLRDGAEPRLAAQGGLQRRRAVPLVPAVGRGALHRHRLLRRPRVLLLVQRHKTGVLPEHAAGAIAPAPITGTPPATPPAPATQG